MAKKTTLTNFWISYSDLMAGLVFVFLAIIVLSNYQYKKQLEIIGESISLRQKIAEELVKTFKENDVASVEVDPETGDIVFTEEEDQIWFMINKDTLLTPGKQILDEVIPLYLAVLFNDEITRDKLDRILIEGHASQERDTTGNYLYNLQLSEKRAHEVGRYIIENNFGAFDKLKAHIVTLGRSYADARYPATITPKGYILKHPDAKKDRRVLIRYNLQYENMMRELGKE